MFYNIYSHITNEQFINLSKELESLERVVSDLVAKEGYSIKTPVSKSDGLIINAGKSADNCYTDISVSVDDLPKKIPTFTVGILKAIDLENKRFYKKVIIKENIDISYLKDNIQNLIKETMNLASKIGKQEVLDSEFVTMRT